HDNDQGSDTGRISVRITNIAPVLGPLSVNDADENGIVTLTGAYTDIGTLDTHTVDINWGPGETPSLDVPVSGGSFSIDHQYLDDNPTGSASDVYQVTVTLHDDDLGVDSGSTTATITNLAPVLGPLFATDINENGIVALVGT